MYRRLFLLLAALALLAPAAANATDVAVYGAPNTGSWNNDVVAKLQATGQFATVTGVLVNNTTPSLASMLQYDAVLVYSDGVGFQNATQMGNNLADYVDAGGGVVIGVFSFHTSSGAITIQGRFRSGNYVPLSFAGQSGGSMTLVPDIASHPILDGVSYLHNGSSGYHHTCSVQSGANLVAHWSNGRPLVAEWNPSSAGGVVGLNMFPPSSGARSDFWNQSGDGGLLMANALSFVAGGGSPEAEAGGPYMVDEGTAAVLDGSASTDPDNDIDTYEWDCTDDGVYDVSTTSPTSSGCVYGDQMTHTVRLRVTDLMGNSSEDTALVVVQNVAPYIGSFAVPAGFEDVPLTMTANGVDIPEDTISYQWDLGDGSPTTSGETVTHTYADDGIYTVTVIASDEDGGVAAPATVLVTIDNVDPTIDYMALMDGDEGSPVTFSGGGSDVPADTVTLSWDYGDGSPVDTGTTVTHTYDDDGTYTVTLTASDEDGGSFSQTGTVTIYNRPPTITSVTNPGNGPEGTNLSFAATATDPSSADAAGLSFSWEWGDGLPAGAGDAPIHAFPDDAVYTVTLTVDDGDGGIDQNIFQVTIDNVDPTIISTPPAYAMEGVEYTYDPAVSDPGDEVFAWVVGGPTGMTINGGTGHLSWIPTFGDAAGGPVPVTIAVNDGDGGTDAQSYSILVSTIDTDADGMPDGWENENGLDPNDPTDALQDPDGDGNNNITEFNEGTDPWVFDGPSVPILIEPLAGVDVVTPTPDLLAENSTDPQGDDLTYSFEVYDSASLVNLVASISGEPEDISGQTGWKVDVPLIENTLYWWRAAANDGIIDSPWSDPETFFVNEIEEAPPTPTPLYPVDGEVLALPLTEAFFEWSDVEDPEGDVVTYQIRLWDEAMTVQLDEAFTDGVVEARGEWIITTGLVENTWYVWDIAAADELGTVSDFSEPEPFFFSTENEPPTGIVWVQPEDQDEVAGVSPLLIATEGVDPEGTPIQYRFEIDTVNTFDSAGFVTRSIDESLTGTIEWDLADSNELVELAENTWVFARVRGTDADGVPSAWDMISFFVRGENDPPDVPVLMAPEDNFTWEDLEALPQLVIANSSDPEGDAVLYDFAVFADPESAEQLAMVPMVVEDSSGQTHVEFPPAVSPIGDVYWTARALDEHGATSEWAFPNLLRFADDGEIGDDDDSAAIGDDDDDDDDGGDGGCACGSSLAQGAPTGAALLLVLAAPLALLRRRRS
jgi:PKD repeat protein